MRKGGRILKVDGMKFVSDDVGKAVFFTREEAEKALAESMKKE